MTCPLHPNMCCICEQHYAKYGTEGLDKRMSHCAFCLQFSSKRVK